MTLFVFSASSLNVTDETQLAYTKLLSQINSGYILDVRKDCNFDEAISCKKLFIKSLVTVFNIAMSIQPVRSLTRLKLARKENRSFQSQGKNTVPKRRSRTQLDCQLWGH